VDIAGEVLMDGNALGRWKQRLARGTGRKPLKEPAMVAAVLAQEVFIILNNIITGSRGLAVGEIFNCSGTCLLPQY